MAEDPGTIREAIEETRQELADTVEALGEKADVKGRAQSKLTEQADAARAKAGEVTDKVQGSLPDGAQEKLASVSSQAASGAGAVQDQVRRRPQVAVAAVVGVVVLLILRRRRRGGAGSAAAG
jgi:ElaB/YqjD/DUF883 family membrane-anchored ribosome-binding protein